LENSPDAIGIVDEHGKFIKWNKMAAELYGYSFEELRGKSGFDLYADRDEMESMLMDLRRQGSVKKREMLMKERTAASPHLRFLSACFRTGKAGSLAASVWEGI